MCKFEWGTQFPSFVLHLTVLESSLNRTSIFKDAYRVYNKVSPLLCFALTL